LSSTLCLLFEKIIRRSCYFFITRLLAIITAAIHDNGRGMIHTENLRMYVILPSTFALARRPNDEKADVSREKEKKRTKPRLAVSRVLESICFLNTQTKILRDRWRMDRNEKEQTTTAGYRYINPKLSNAQSLGTHRCIVRE
jgi:hypothetical protein